MPNSPYATSFKASIKRGIPCGATVASIAKRTGKSPSVIFSSLYREELLYRQKLNGQWIYWPIEGFKRSVTNAKKSQLEMFQSFVDWCIASGQCKPEQLYNQTGSQENFIANCRKYYNKQLKATSGSRTPTTAKRRTASSKSRRPSSRSYAFPKSTRRYRRAA